MKTKKDLNYIVKLEQAIKKKYGKEAIQHPKANWDEDKEKEYLEQIKIISEKDKRKSEKVEKVEKEGFSVSKKLLKRESNRVCPVCENYSFNKKDDLYMIKYGCCWTCCIQYVEGREERWISGWRPNNENYKGTVKTDLLRCWQRVVEIWLEAK